MSNSQTDKDTTEHVAPRSLSPERQNDLKQAAQIAAKDKTAMKGLYEDLCGPLTAFVRRWLHNPEEAPDVINDVMIEVWQKADRYQGRSALKSWVFTIARNKAVDRNRKDRRLSYTDDVPDMEDTSPSALQSVADKENATALEMCMTALSLPHRRAIHLAFYEDMTYAEIATIEDCPVGTIKTRILHAKKLLARCVESKGSNR